MSAVHLAVKRAALLGETEGTLHARADGLYLTVGKQDHLILTPTEAAASDWRIVATRRIAAAQPRRRRRDP